MGSTTALMLLAIFAPLAAWAAKCKAPSGGTGFYWLQADGTQGAGFYPGAVLQDLADGVECANYFVCATVVFEQGTYYKHGPYNVYGMTGCFSEYSMFDYDLAGKCGGTGDATETQVSSGVLTTFAGQTASGYCTIKACGNGWDACTTQEACEAATQNGYSGVWMYNPIAAKCCACTGDNCNDDYLCARQRFAEHYFRTALRTASSCDLHPHSR